MILHSPQGLSKSSKDDGAGAGGVKLEDVFEEGNDSDPERTNWSSIITGGGGIAAGVSDLENASVCIASSIPKALALHFMVLLLSLLNTLSRNRVTILA